MLAEGRVRKVPVDAYRRGNELNIDLDLPGAHSGSIDFTVERDVLNVGATCTPHRDQGDEIQVAEQPQGQFSPSAVSGRKPGPGST